MKTQVTLNEKEMKAAVEQFIQSLATHPHLGNPDSKLKVTNVEIHKHDSGFVGSLDPRERNPYFTATAEVESE